ncbi:VWA domain-containing protein [Aliagarivorans marinus]|uniref:VWA domain-containing protein n=1 Tax=Aliagarivorans marinus TaxID=561965 RepID=UPI00040813AD|nr:VWA domain-containing protein [Aliagarivorans marinus]
MNAFHFLRPWWLLTLIPLLALTYRLARIKAADHHAPYIADHLRSAVLSAERARPGLSPLSLLPWVLTAVIVVCAGPTWQPANADQVENKAVTTLLLDLSSSMNSSDLTPNRLENAKLKISQLLDTQEDGLISIWVFAGSAHQVLPPTKDFAVVRHYLESLTSALMPLQGKNLDSAMEKLLSLHLSAANNQPGSIVLVTDSVDSAGQQAIQRYVDSAAAQFIVWKFGYDSSMSLPATVQLVTASADDSDVVRIDKRLGSYRYFDPHDSAIEWQESGYYLVFALLVVVALWFRKGWSLSWVAVCILSTTVAGYSNSALAHEPALPAVTERPFSAPDACDNLLMRWFMSADQQGRWHYERENWACAAQAFSDPQWKIIALMRNQQWEWALMMLATLPQDTAEQRSFREFNFGVAYTHLQRFRSAETHFMRVLESNPTHPQALHNLTVLEEIFDLMALRAQGQGTAGEDMTADVIDALAEDMGIEEPEDKIEVVNSADIIAEEHLTKIWMEQVKTNPEVFLRNKFALQLNAEINSHSVQSPLSTAEASK